MAISFTDINPENLLESLGALANVLIFAVALSCVVGIGLYIIRMRKYSWIIRVFERDSSGNLVQLADDKGGIFLDRTTNYRLLLLRKHKFGLDPDHIPYIMNSRGRRITYLLRTGLKNYQFLKPVVEENKGIKFNVEDEDVAWAVNAYQKYKIPNKNDLLKQILPILGIAVFGIIIVIMIYLILEKFDVLSDVANALVQATDNMQRVNTGTTVVE